MDSTLVTGAAGFIGRVACLALANSQIPFLGIDRKAAEGVSVCDLNDPGQLRELFMQRSFRAVIHLAAMLPGAAAQDPMLATEINVGGSVRLLEQSVSAGVRRFVFGSSTSVYGTAGTTTPIDETSPAAPIDVYGASKRMVEIVGEKLSAEGKIDFVSLRIATVVGPGAHNTSSPWRSEIFEKLGQSAPQTISLPYCAEDLLTVVHADDLARMLLVLAGSEHLRAGWYNTPAELCTAGEIKAAVEHADSNVEVKLAGRSRPLAPLADGRRFSTEFGFEAMKLASRLKKQRRLAAK
jgi:nucleoside-diphosphate-sugar epimerase